MRILGTVLAASVALQLVSCVTLVRRVDVIPIEPESPPAEVATPVKAHLMDGAIAVFAAGLRVENDTLRGRADYYPPGLLVTDSVVTALALDRIVGLETYDGRIRAAESLVLSAITVPLSVIAASALAVAVFGSCPTIYSGDGDEAELQAELFPNSIAALFEMRDLDRLSVQPNADGVLRLEVRNEALETHYINHLRLLAAPHAPDELVVAAEDHSLAALSDFAPLRASDAVGRNVTEVLSLPDERVYSSDLERLGVQHADVTAADTLMDWIELNAPMPAADTVALSIRARNSLLGTVFFYDYMLAQQGPGALDWLGRDLEVISNALEMADFYKRRMGLRVEVFRDGAYRQVDRVREVGPIAFDHVAVPFATPPGDTLRVRLRFVADGWRIDQVALAQGVRRVVPETHAPARLIAGAAGGTRGGEDLERIGAPDEDYVTTGPGSRFWLEFDTGARSDPHRSWTYLIDGQGYYTEWVRADWIRNNPVGKEFQPGDEVLARAQLKWRQVRDVFEQQFFDHRVPVANASTPRASEKDGGGR